RRQVSANRKAHNGAWHRISRRVPHSHVASKMLGLFRVAEMSRYGFHTQAPQKSRLRGLCFVGRTATVPLLRERKGGRTGVNSCYPHLHPSVRQPNDAVTALYGGTRQSPRLLTIRRLCCV